MSSSNSDKVDVEAAIPREGETYRHLRRGSTYSVLGRATLQTDCPIGDNHELVVYRDESGQLWVRPVAEFFDGRFEQLLEKS